MTLTAAPSLRPLAAEKRRVEILNSCTASSGNCMTGPPTVLSLLSMPLPHEAVQEFNISTQRFSAANGRSEGAAVNVITKSGTNNLHGSLYFFDRSDALNSL